MAREYYAGVVHEESGSYGIHFPDLPGCISGGDSLAKCLENAEEAATVYIEELVNDGKPIPAPSAFADVTRIALGDEEDRQGLVAIQMVPATLPAKAVRLTISMDEGLVKRIDAVAGHYGRSEWLADAAREKLATRRSV